MWLLVWLLLSAVFLKVGIEGTIKYFSYPYKAHVTYENIHNHTLPDVTICNNNIIRKSFYENDSVAAKYFDYPGNIFAPELLNDPEVARWMRTTDFVTNYLNAMAPAHKFISNCRYGIFDVPCPNMTQITSNYGACYILSGFVNGTGQTIVSSLPGLTYAYKFDVDIDADDYSVQANSNGVGIKVMIHPNGIPPNTAYTFN